MATKDNNPDSALDAIKKALGAKCADFSHKAAVCLNLLDAALGFFAAEGALAKALVEVQAQTREGGRYVCKYSLGTKVVNGEEVAYLKKSELEEDE